LKYTDLEKTCWALTWATKRLRHYMLSFPVILISRMDPLKYLFEKPALSGRISRWVLMLSEFDITYATSKSVKGRAIAEHLAEHPQDGEKDEYFAFPDESIMKIEEGSWKMYFDGVVNRKGYGIGVILESPEGVHTPFAAKLCYHSTNNTAEYEACVVGMEAALRLGVEELDVFGDSNLVVCQARGRWKIKGSSLKPFHDYLEELKARFKRITFKYLPREDNQLADALATLSSMITLPRGGEKMAPLTIERRFEPSYGLKCIMNALEQEDSDTSPWYVDVWNFIEKGQYPEGASDKDKLAIRRFSSQFFINGGVLFKRSYDGYDLVCLSEANAARMMEQIHEGVCGPHMSGHMLAKKIMRQGYYWTTMDKDCCDYVRRCHRCQIHANRMNIPPSMLYNMTTPWPFATWGIDIIGEITPRASNGHRYILVAIDYFTK